MENGARYLINTDRMHVMPDGNEYNAFWGVCEFVPVDKMEGIRPTTRETNWFLKMNNVYIAGCEIHCWVQTDTPPVKLAKKVWDSAVAGIVMNVNIYYTDDLPNTL